MPRPTANPAPRSILHSEFESLPRLVGVQPRSVGAGCSKACPGSSGFKVLPGFTLIELLVVISIIAILASIAFPVFNNVLVKARKADALATINNVRTALVAYQTEYSDWPPSLVALGTNGTDARIDADATFTSPGKWQATYQTLTATGDTNALATNNKRRMVFIEFAPKQLDDKLNPTNATTFVDPWGREFSIVIDSNGDNILENVPNVGAGSGNMTINGSMAIWSYGPEPTKRKEWVASWK